MIGDDQSSSESAESLVGRLHKYPDTFKEWVEQYVSPTARLVRACSISRPGGDILGKDPRLSTMVNEMLRAAMQISDYLHGRDEWLAKKCPDEQAYAHRSDRRNGGTRDQ